MRTGIITTYLHKLTLQSHRLELYARVLHVDVQIAIARADAAIAFYDPAFDVVERRGEGYGVADELAVAGGLVLGQKLVVRFEGVFHLEPA